MIVCIHSGHDILTSAGAEPSLDDSQEIVGTTLQEVLKGIGDLVQVTLRDVDDMEEELRARKQYAKSQSAEAYESSDEEEGSRGQQVRCAQQ